MGFIKLRNKNINNVYEKSFEILDIVLNLSGLVIGFGGRGSGSSLGLRMVGKWSERVSWKKVYKFFFFIIEG